MKFIYANIHGLGGKAKKLSLKQLLVLDNLDVIGFCSGKNGSECSYHRINLTGTPNHQVNFL